MSFIKQFRKQQGITPQTFGKTPTTSEKIINRANKFGIGGLASMQGSAVNLFDTATIATSAQSQTITFFKNTGSKTRVFSNWQSQEFKAGESMGLSYLYLHIVQILNTNLTDSANTITNFFPVGKTIATSVLAYGIGQFKIANSTVFKDYQLLELLPSFNPKTQGVSAYDLTAVGINPVIIGRSVIELPTDTFIPPNQGIELTIEIPPITLPVGNFAVMATLGRQGSIFSAKASF